MTENSEPKRLKDKLDLLRGLAAAAFVVNVAIFAENNKYEHRAKVAEKTEHDTEIIVPSENAHGETPDPTQP